MLFRLRVAAGEIVPATPDDDAAWALAGPKDRRPGEHAADAAIEVALATYEALTGAPGTRINVEVPTGPHGTRTTTERRGGALSFCRALDGFYGIKVASDQRLKLRLVELRQRAADLARMIAGAN